LLKAAILVFLILSFVSLFADIAYEGARSISGPYLELLGASLVVAGGISLGELLSYAARFAGGLLAFRLASSRAYWALLVLGYTVNLVAVPLLALAGSWELALALYILERVGKGFRVPIRDTILAEVSAGVGSGKVFALHELLDQVGGVAGPLMVAYVASRSGSYKAALASLAIPAAIAIALLLLASTLYPEIRSARKPEVGVRAGLSSEFYTLMLAIALALASFIHWGQASYLLSLGGFSGESVALLYAVAMAVDGLAAIPLGLAFDRWSVRVSALLPILALTSTLALTIAGNPLAFTLLWGITMGAMEVVPKALVARLVREEYRSLAYSILFMSMGAGWTAGNMLVAYLNPYTWSSTAIVALSAALSLILTLRASQAEEGGAPLRR